MMRTPLATVLAFTLAAVLLGCSSGPSTARGFVAEHEAGADGSSPETDAGDTDAPANTACCTYPAADLTYPPPTACPVAVTSPCGGDVLCDGGGCSVNGMAGTLAACPVCSGVYQALAWDAGLVLLDDASFFTTGPDGGVYFGLPGSRLCGSGGIVDVLGGEDVSCKTPNGTPLVSTVCVCARGRSCAQTAPGSDLDGGYQCL